jgi:hypothetical protein
MNSVMPAFIFYDYASERLYNKKAPSGGALK